MSSERDRSLTARYAERVLRNSLTERYNARQNKLQGVQEQAGAAPTVGLPPWTIPEPEKKKKKHGGVGEPSPSLPENKICIIGAGAAGLRLAMLCEETGFEYDILEASDRVGGRLFTYGFPKSEPVIEHNYYDVGAMRIPHIKIMEPLLNLIETLELGHLLKPYYFKNTSAPNLYYNQTMSTSEVDSFSKPLTEAVAELVKALIDDFDAGFKALEELDKYSTREYLMREKGMSFQEIQWIETFNTGSGLFDQSFVETVLRVYEFNIAKEWSRLDGGLQRLSDAMHDSLTLKDHIHLNKRVNKLTLSADKKVMLVHVANEDTPRTYDTVFCTTTLPSMANMDLGGAELTLEQQTAIRALGYDRSCKVAIKFSRNWWADMSVGAGTGGSSFTDLPIRTTVFPSWVDTDPSQPAVLICSYTWAQDATRVGALIKSDTDPVLNADLLDLIFQNLSRVFFGKISPNELRKLMIAHHAYAWSHDKHMGGAFALFGPDQFKHIYPAVQDPAANGHLYIAGECVSAHHAWIVGALESARLAFLKYLCRNGELKKMSELKHSTEAGAPGEIPEETEEDLIYWQVQLSIDEQLAF